MPKLKAVVIGSGFGGLAAAIRLQASGVDVTIFEKREQIGGRAYQLKDSGYTFDMGPSLVTATEIIDSVFKAGGTSLNHEVDLLPLDPFYRVHYHDGTHIDYSGDVDDMKAQMAVFNNNDAENLDRFLDDIKPVFDAVITDGLGAIPFDNLKQFASFIPQALKLKAYKSVAAFTNTYFEDFRHRFLFSFHPLFIGGNPFYAPALYIMIPYLEKEQGVWYIRGGMYTLVQAMANLFVNLGGEIRTGTPVDEIITDGRRATGVRAGADKLQADMVVSNADVVFTYKNLLPGVTRKKWTDRKLDRLKQSMSCFLLYLGVRKKYPQLNHHTLIIAERYKQLLEDIFRRKILSEDFSLYLHIPSRTDETMAPEGCESIYILAPVPNLHADVDWHVEAPRFRKKIIDFLEDWGLDGLEDSIEVEHAFTPLDFESELNAEAGNAFGIEPVLTQSAYFRPHNRSEEVDNLYFVGAGTHPGAGIPGVMLSAEATMVSITEDFSLEPANPIPRASTIQ